MTEAPGAMPLTAPRSTPSTVAWATGPPAAVVAVCVPWPSESRAEQVLPSQYSPGAAPCTAR